VKNAIKYTDKGFIEIGYTKEEDDLRFYVKDTGTGISEDQREKIFERFRQADMSIHRDYEGAGLGLSISKAYVELLGGEIWMTSKMNEGSTFYFTIPYELPGQKEEELIDLVDGPTKEDINDLTLLVAEDDEASFHLIKEMMEDTDVKLIRAENGKEAIEKTENNQLIDLVLMDIKMPVLDGYQATKLIKKQFPNLPIIAQTAFASKKDKQKALKEGCDDYIAKPIREDELIAILLKYQKPSKSDVS
jgi:CheY-like chemotaxis protein